MIVAPPFGTLIQMPKKLRIALLALGSLVTVWIAAVHRLPAVKARKASWRA
jgi:hypothetical protein